MKKLLLSIIMCVALSTGLFATQICREFDTRKLSTKEITRQIQDYIDRGWKVVSMVTVSNRMDRMVDAGLSTSIIVVFELED